MGILRVSVDDSVRIEAIKARIHLTVAGSSLITGGIAARKASEVRELVAALSAHGITEDDLQIVGLRSETGSGLLTKSQKVSLSLVVTSTPEPLGAVLGTLTSRPGLRVDELEWVYDEFEASVAATAAAMPKARRKAEALAAAAGQRIVGIAEINDSWNRSGPRMVFASALAFDASAKAAPEMDLGFDLTGSDELSVHLSVDFLIDA